MKIIYFSGTGNSLYVANKFIDSFSGEKYSISYLIDNNIYEIEDDIVGIVFPIYYLNIPKVVNEYLSRLRINSKYIFVITTHALFAFETKKKVCSFNFNVDYFTQIKMPNNYIPWTDMKKTNAKKDFYSIEIDKVIEDIDNRKIDVSYNKIKYIVGEVIRKFNDSNPASKDTNFYVNSNCTLCKICEKACAVNNIDVSNCVVFKHQCEQCLSCINCCPQKAIHHNKEKSSDRYINKYIDITDLLK